MLQPEPSALLRTLNSYCTKGLEQAAGVCVSRSHYEVTVEHLLSQLLADPNADLYLILRHYDFDQADLEAALQRHLEVERTGNTGRPVFSPLLLSLFRDAWLLASTEHKLPAIRSGAIFATLLLSPHSYTTGSYPDLLTGISRDELRHQLLGITAGSVEHEDAPRAAAGSAEDGAAAVGPHSRGPETALGRFTNDFTAQAREGELDPVIGRETEIRQCIDILARRRKNNPIIVGEAGTGKTALVEGIAQRVVDGEMPTQLANVDILGLDLGLLQAGAGMKGEFENRLKGVIEEVKASPKPIILFIDEAHTIIGAGGAEGGSDAANLLKPALARGELRTLAATTWSEYKKYFEKDPALTRRFQLVKVDEPSEEGAIAMMRGLTPHYEKSHKIRIRDDAVMAAVQLSNRFISGRQLPDKAVDLLDTCAARVAIAQNAKPAALFDLERTIQILDREKAALTREEQEGYNVDAKRMQAVEHNLATTLLNLQELKIAWEEEQKAVQSVLELRGQVEETRRQLDEARGHGKVPPSAFEETGEVGQGGTVFLKDAAIKPTEEETEEEANEESKEQAGEHHSADHAAVTPGDDTEPPEERLSTEALEGRMDELVSQLEEAQEKVDAQQKDRVLVPLDVVRELVASVVSDWTGIPAGKMVQDEAATLLELEQRIGERIRGQDFALSHIAEVIRAAKMGLGNPRAPIGSFLAVGPSGVGKTETGRALADMLFGGERFMVTINMSEFQEKHTVSRLIGSPPGYVGYGEGGVLTEAVRQRPYSAVMLDEVEKADPEVMNLFYQVFDKGEMADGEGRVIDFKNTVILMTSNLASDVMTEMYASVDPPSPEQVISAIRPILSNHFKPALLARMTIVPFFPLSGEAMREIVDLKLKELQDRMMTSHAISLSIDEAVAAQIAARCAEVETGARNIDHILSRTLLPLLARTLLNQMASGPLPDLAELSLADNGEYEIIFP